MHDHSRRRTLGVVFAGLIGAALTLGVGAPAQAAPLVDPDETGTITIHKHEQPSQSGTVNNGLEQTVTTDPIEGVTYRLRQVNALDLTTNAGWQAAAALADAYDGTEASITGAGYALGAAIVDDTAADGTVTFDDLPLGLYLIDETATPSGVVASAPFLLTVPLTHPTELDSWLYDLNVYPKNSVVGGSKTVTDAPAVQVGDDITYTILGDIPTGAVTDAYRISDVLDDKLDYANVTVSLSDGTAWTEGTHYTLTQSGQNVQIDLTQAGREAAFAAVSGDPAVQVQVDLAATVNATGVIVNEADIFPNQPAIDQDVPVTPPAVESRFGGITVDKNAPDGSPLAGAVFEVHYSATDDFGTAVPVTADDGVTARTWTTGADGTTAIDTLRYSNFANNAAVAPGDPEYRYYWLVEVAAPDGYELLAEPIQFLVTDRAANVSVPVTNVPHNSDFTLPLTGATGTGLFTVAGILIVAGAILLAVRGRRTADA